MPALGDWAPDEQGMEVIRQDQLLRRDFSVSSAVVLAFLTRVIILVLWVTTQDSYLSDVAYYHDRTQLLGKAGLDATLREYPTPVVWLLSIPHLFSDDLSGYGTAFMVMLLLFDLFFCALLWRFGGAHRNQAIVFWSVFLMAMGPLVWLRFDVVPAILVGGAALFALSRPRVAGGLLGLGAAIKLWPVALFPLLLTRGRRRGALLGLAITGGGLAVISVIAGGWQRLLSPLFWQSDRGLQIESVWATGPMLARLADLDNWQVQLSPYQAYEIFGPGVDAMLVLTRVATVLAIAFCLALVARTLFPVPRPGLRLSRPAGGTAAIATTMLAFVALIIVTNKTLSPQYIPWLGGCLTVVVARLGLSRGTVRRWALTLVAMAALSQLVFPELYPHLLGIASTPQQVAVATLVLTLRNSLLVAFTIDVCVVAWRQHDRAFATASRRTSSGAGLASETSSHVVRDLG